MPGIAQAQWGRQAGPWGQGYPCGGAQVVPKKVPLLVEVSHGCREWEQGESGLALEADEADEPD